jgi:hypothetical protein
VWVGGGKRERERERERGAPIIAWALSYCCPWYASIKCIKRTHLLARIVICTVEEKTSVGHPDKTDPRRKQRAYKISIKDCSEAA